ncbi:unnamed protein product [Aureobasidium uvarum]|uniref:F-box domain-containing protein n=1 Tax=Aureobasidium uvarum TaxID=2773716 RepID=A0A9N8PNS8_9PEZI|nr:unnamed protein product [Aureobasidium uvarum]
MKTTISTNALPTKTPKQPYGVFPPELWLEITKQCPTRSLKTLALTNKYLHAISSDQLLRTVILLGENSLGEFKLDPSLDKATLIKDPATFNRLVLEHRSLRWYKAVKTVFVVKNERLYVTRRSALPLVCYYITWHYAPRELVKYTWKVWVKSPIVVTLWPPETWPFKHSAMPRLEGDFH